MLKVKSFWSVNDKEVLTNVYRLTAKSFRKQALPAAFLTAWNPLLKSPKQREQSKYGHFV